MKAFTGFAIGTLAVLGAVAAVFIYLKKKTEKEIAYDQFDDGRQFCDIEQYDPQCECHVSQCHHGDEYAADFGYSLDSAEAKTAEEKEPEAETQE